MLWQYSLLEELNNLLGAVMKKLILALTIILSFSMPSQVSAGHGFSGAALPTKTRVINNQGFAARRLG